MFRRLSLIAAFLAAFMLPAGVATTVSTYSTDAVAKKGHGGGRGGHRARGHRGHWCYGHRRHNYYYYRHEIRRSVSHWNGRWWGGRWYAYGVGPCWSLQPGGLFIWVC